MSDRVKIGVIGAGSIAQQMHLPYLADLGERFELAGICDISAELGSRMASKYRVPYSTPDYRRLLERDLDAVLICISAPAEEVVTTALGSGRHVFVEKPLAWTPARACEIEAAQVASGKVLMVGYMKRHDPGYELAARWVESMGEIRLGLVHDVAGPNQAFIRDVAHVMQPSDLAPSALEAVDELKHERIREAIGDAGPVFTRAYRVLLSLCSHDLNLLRGLLGAPRSVHSCAVWQAGNFIAALLEFPTCSVTFEAGMVALKRFDERVELFSDSAALKLSFPSPFIKHAPTLATRWRMDRDGLHEEHVVASYEEAFRRELVHFHECISQGIAPRTSVTEARQDVELVAGMICRAMTSK